MFLNIKTQLLFAVVAIMTIGCASMGVRSIPVEKLMEKYDVKPSDFIEVGSVKIHYKDEGSGPPLFLLHGICASLYTWDGWVEALKDRYRIIRIDVPGWGLTGDIGPDGYNLEKMIEIIDGVTEALELDSFYLAGNSLGGYFSWNYALIYPEKVKKMILLDPVSYPQKAPWFIGLAGVPVLNFFPKHFMPKFLVSMNVKAVYGDPNRITDDIYDLYFDLTLREGNRESYVNTFAYLAKAGNDPNLGEKIKYITVPTLLMFGEKDRWVSTAHIKEWEKDLPGVLSIIYPGAGHVPMEELPKQTARDADQFFQNGFISPKN